MLCINSWTAGEEQSLKPSRQLKGPLPALVSYHYMTGHWHLCAEMDHSDKPELFRDRSHLLRLTSVTSLREH